MSKRLAIGELSVDADLYDLLVNEILPGTGVDEGQFWKGFASIVHDLSPKNRELLEKRNILQDQLDHWHSQHTDSFEVSEYKNFLVDIGYLETEGDTFEVSTENVDPEIATIAGPQLVVPVDNARYALNAANARWGSLYDALYGTDVITEDPGFEKTAQYNPRRGAKVVAYAAQVLDEAAPLIHGSHATVEAYSITDSGELMVLDQGGAETALRDPNQFVGYRAENGVLTNVLLRKNGLHLDIEIDRQHPIGATHPAGVKDVVLEAAITAIQDCEDSVAAVDAADKVGVYRNWTGLMKGDLSVEFTKGDRVLRRRLNPDRVYTAKRGGDLVLPGRGVLLVRNVGMHLYSDAVLDSDNQPIPETIMDAIVTSLAAMHDLKRSGDFKNSRAGSVYIVKPKMHGPEEVALAVELFGRVESVLGLSANTLKIGIMDEEKRTTVNLAECIREAKERVIFINTGFLDRTGDEIHTAMKAGAMIPKPEMKNALWISAYEDWNVDVGIRCGLPGRAQIGKGMWAMPDAMADMMETKIGHPLAGANTAWVPSPTAATLHAIHYHKVHVSEVQEALRSREHASLDHLLTIPTMKVGRILDEDEIARELENNAQGILGYVVRWIDQGVGCSKVPDINNIDLMEDRATLRISSQMIANWLHHKITTKEQVVDVFKRMAKQVDEQNSNDSAYMAMAPSFDTVAFQAALDMVFKGVEEPNGYTEPTLTARRREFKADG